MRPYLIGLVVLLARVATVPRTPWDVAELRFPFVAMVAISVLASVATAIALAVWGAGFPLANGDGQDARHGRAGSPTPVVASLLFSFSAGVMVHAPAARLDSLGWMFVALALLCLRKPVLLGAFAAAAMACGIVSALALFFAALMLIVTERRDRAIAAIAFVVVLLPFVAIPESLPLPPGLSIARFTLHPWGSKFVALPVLVAVIAGIRPVIRRWNEELEVLMWFAAIHVAFGIAFVDPADGVRYGVVVLHDREPAAFAKGIPLDEGLRRHRRRRSAAALRVRQLERGGREGVFARRQRRVRKASSLPGDGRRSVSAASPANSSNATSSTPSPWRSESSIDAIQCSHDFGGPRTARGISRGKGFFAKETHRFLRICLPT